MNNLYIQKLAVRGIVQGVGFRPFICKIASEYSIKGWVLNDSNGVTMEVEGNQENLDGFITAIKFKHPPLAMVDEVKIIQVRKSKGTYTDFTIKHSQASSTSEALISPDTTVCDDCLKELFNPDNRRFQYPFINCTNCGPRYSIIQNIPYDRPFTTMKNFSMCEECLKEYQDIRDRRFHAQPVACWKCGPQVNLLGR